MRAPTSAAVTARLGLTDCASPRMSRLCFRVGAAPHLGTCACRPSWPGSNWDSSARPPKRDLKISDACFGVGLSVVRARWPWIEVEGRHAFPTLLHTHTLSLLLSTTTTTTMTMTTLIEDGSNTCYASGPTGMSGGVMTLRKSIGHLHQSLKLMSNRCTLGAGQRAICPSVRHTARIPRYRNSTKGTGSSSCSCCCRR